MTSSPPAPSFAERGDEKIDFKELTRARYSLRKFDPRPIEEEKLRLLMEAAQSAPTAHNNQPQHVLVCRSPEALERVNRCTSMHFGAPVVLVVCYDESAAWVRTGIDEKNHGEIDAAIATTQIMLQAADLGLGTTYVGVFDPERLRQELPELAGRTPIALLPVGYPAEGAHPNKLHTQRKPLEEFYTEL